MLEAQQTTVACDRWLEAWDLVTHLASPQMRTPAAFDQAHPLGQSVFNWCQDLEMELGNAGLDDPVYHDHRLRYAREFLAQFPDWDTLLWLNFTRAQGEALWKRFKDAFRRHPTAIVGMVVLLAMIAVAIFARWAGLRYVTPVTSVPNVTRSVRAASHARVV